MSKRIAEDSVKPMSGCNSRYTMDNVPANNTAAWKPALAAGEASLDKHAASPHYTPTKKK